MKRILMFLAATSLFLASTVFAADKNYQVTGPVLELDAHKIVVQKGHDRWELARSPELKLGDDVKVGSKVTIAYKMTATSVEPKAGKATKAMAGANKVNKGAGLGHPAGAHHAGKAKATKEAVPAPLH